MTISRREVANSRIGPEEVRQRYPKPVPDFIALRGDPSDKLPGAAGVGSKRALGSSFCSPSVAQGRSHPLSRNDFSSQRLETARVATLSQHSVSDWIKNEPAKLFGEPQRPPTLVCPGAGGWRAISRPENEIQCRLVSCSNGGVLTVESTRNGDREQVELPNHIYPQRPPLQMSHEASSILDFIPLAVASSWSSWTA
jgi:hypothetical protein